MSHVKVHHVDSARLRSVIIIVSVYIWLCSDLFINVIISVSHLISTQLKLGITGNYYNR